MIFITNLKKILVFIAVIVFFSCEQDVLETDLIQNIEFSKTTLVANGSDVANIKIFFNKAANIDLIKLKIETTNGTFLSNLKNTIEITPKENIEGEIFAEVNLVSSSIHTDYNITFEISKYFLYRNVTSTASEPTTIALSSNSFSVHNNFNGEINLEALLSNDSFGKVSNGYQVKFTDTFIDGSPVNGSFRAQNLTSNSESKVSTIYSPGTISANQYIYLTVEILDNNDDSTGISDTLKIYVTQNQ